MYYKEASPVHKEWYGGYPRQWNNLHFTFAFRFTFVVKLFNNWSVIIEYTRIGWFTRVGTYF